MKIQLDQQRHAFGFGAAVTGDLLTGHGTNSERYREIVDRNFSKVVFENELKWSEWEGESPQARQKTFESIQWLRERGIAIRGHNIIWPSWHWLPKNLEALRDNPEALRARITSHIVDVVGATRGQCEDWDVINEPFANHDLMNILGNDAMVEWFRLTRAADPLPRLFLNDYAGLMAGGLNTAHKDHFEKTIRFLKDKGAPIGGIGIQAHYGYSITPPEKLLSELDRWQALGLPVQITEFDLDMRDEEFQATYTRDFLLATFSHPAVTSILTWGFWEGRHWRPDAAMWRKDWTLKPNGKVWTELTRQIWWTQATGTTDAQGEFKTRGFYGQYEVRAADGNLTKTLQFQMPKDHQTVTIKLSAKDSKAE